MGELRPDLTQCRLGRGTAYVRTKWHLDPSNRLVTIHQRYRQDNGPIAYSEALLVTVAPQSVKVGV